MGTLSQMDMGSRSASTTYNPSDTGQLSRSLKRGSFVCKTEGGNAGHPETARRLNQVDVACAWHLVSLRYAAVTPLCVTSTLMEEEVSAPGVGEDLAVPASNKKPQGFRQNRVR